MSTQANIPITSTALGQKVQSAKTPADVREIIKQAQAEIAGMKWRALGDRENNAGTVQIASSAAAALIERITNGMDGQIELLGMLNPSDSPASPRQAARQWFGVPVGGIADMDDSQRRKLAEGMSVTMEDSGARDRPTVVVTDSGVGQHPLDAPITLLSLNGSNKIGSPHLHGAYGQGAAATYRFAKYTVIVTRRAPEFNGGRDDLVGWTVVWEDPGDPTTDKLPVYRYLVGPDGNIPAFEPHALAGDTAWHGVRVAHVAYDLRGFTGAYNQPRNGIWALFHNALFDPVLPFLISGNRDIDASAAGKGTTRVVVGNTARLNNPSGLRGDLEIAHRNSVTFDLTKATGNDYGTTNIRYWVVRNKTDLKADPTASFVTPDTAIAITLSGQRQDSEGRVWLKAKVKLPFLYKKLIVQIDVDGLTPLAKRELFSSTRERAIDSDLRDLIYAEVADTLRGDDELRRLDREERNRLLAESADKVDDKIREKLRKYIDTLTNKKRKVRKAVPTKIPPQTRTSGGPSKRSIDDKHLHADPTYIRFEKPKITIVQGGNTTVWVEIDAKNGYLPRNEHNLVVTIDPSAAGEVADVSKSELLGGKSLWKFHATLDAKIGEHSVDAVLVTPNGVLAAKTTIEVKPAPVLNKTRTVEEPDNGPIVEWVKEAEWAGLGWSEQTVGEVKASSDETLILVNRDQRLLKAAVDNNRKLSEGQIKHRAERYLLPVACGLFEQHRATEGATDIPSDSYVAGEMERLAGAVILAISEDLLDDISE